MSASTCRATTQQLQLIKKLAEFSFVQLDDDTIVLSRLLPLSPSLPPKRDTAPQTAIVKIQNTMTLDF